MSSNLIKILTSNNFKEEVENSSQVVLVDFWAPWCGPCRMVAPSIDDLAGQYSGRATIAKLNVDDEPELAAKFRVMSIPTIAIFKNGVIVDKVVGVRSVQELSKWLETHIGD